MEISFSEEFKKSWLTSLIGFVLFLSSVWLLTWNEGNAVHHAHSLDEAYNNVIILNPFEPIRPELDGRLVHISGGLVIDEPLTEIDYGISIQAVKLKRRVQMYQWIEERTQHDYANTIVSETSDNEYFYVTEWRDKIVDSQSFYIRHGHQNPKDMPLKTQTYISPFVRVGHLSLGQSIKEKFLDYVEMTSDERPERRDIKLHMGIYYHCDDVWNPEVGDIRVQFYYAGLNGESVTIIAMQKDGVLVPYTTSKGHSLALLRYGILSVTQMFDSEHFDLKLELWKIRLAGIFVMYASIVCLIRLLKIICSKLPILRTVLNQEISASINLSIAVSTSLLVISTAWIMYRPVIGAGLVLAGLSPLFYCIMGVYNGLNNQNNYHQR